MILIINIGSSSKKYSVYENGEEKISAHFEYEVGGYLIHLKHGENIETLPIDESDFVDSLNFLIRRLVEDKVFGEESVPEQVGIRIVAPGEYFTAHRSIDDEFIKHLESAALISPLHIKPVLQELKRLKKVLPDSRLFGVSDSAYHTSMKDEARVYGIPRDIAEEYGVYRYGYHGLSAESVLWKLSRMQGGVPKRIIICHLGSGVSVMALRDGKSVDTSMGFTPFEGIPMGGRVGDIDPGAVLYLSKLLRKSSDKMREFLETESGLKGISGTTGDMRELLLKEAEGDKHASLALRSFIFRIRKYIGSHLVTLCGADAIIFTGTAGDRSFVLRKRILSGFASFGFVLDEMENSRHEGGKDGFIQEASSEGSIIVLGTDEGRVMERVVSDLSLS